MRTWCVLWIMTISCVLQQGRVIQQQSCNCCQQHPLPTPSSQCEQKNNEIQLFMVEKDLRTLVEGMSRFAPLCLWGGGWPQAAHFESPPTFSGIPPPPPPLLHPFPVSTMLLDQCIEMAFLSPFKINDWKLCTCYLDVIYASKGVFESVLVQNITTLPLLAYFERRISCKEYCDGSANY